MINTIISIILKLRDKYLQLLLSLLCGMFGILGFSPYDFWPASIISLTGLFLIILNSKWKKAAWNTLFWGMGFFGFGLHWISIGINQFINTFNCIHLFLIMLLVVYLTCFPILFSILFTFLQSFITKWNLISIVASVLWSIIERLRGDILLGFPWLQLGYTQIDGPIKGIAPILGVEGITFVLVYISSLLAISIKTTQLFPMFLTIVILILSWGVSWIQWYHIQPQYITTVALVQGNINQHLYWDDIAIKSTLQIYLKHTLPILGKVKIVIWPESAIPGNEIIHNKFLTWMDYQLKKYHTYLITGIIDTRYIKDNYYHYNSIIVIGDNNPYQYPSYNRYNKHHLVLCSEQLPFQNFFRPLLKFLNIPYFFMKKGHYLQPPLHIDNIKMTSAICYEIIIGQQIRDNFKPDTNFILIIANDVWFGNSIGPWQHFQMIRMRALELGRPVLCATNNGITAIIRADGSIQSKLPQFISDVLYDSVISTSGITPYAKFGSWWLSGCIIILIIYFIVTKYNYKNV